MSGSAELYQRLHDPNSVIVDGRGYLGSISNSYMVNGAHRECHPDFVATPIGSSPYGFLVCQRKVDPITGIPPEAKRNETPLNYVPHNDLESEARNGALYSQSYDLYNNHPNSKPRTTKLGGQPYAFTDRRLPNQAHLQGADYYRDPIKFRGIGIENVNSYPGDFGYDENKYYYSSPPPLFDITQAVQPYEIWRREQLRMGTLTLDEMKAFEKEHTYRQDVATF